jgi:hypothetical protein
VRLVGADEVPRFNALLDEHHFLGHCLSGRVLRYVAMVSGEWVALVGFGSAALSVRVREELIGWDEATRYRRLRYVSNNQRFCVLPGGRGPNVASAVLGGVLRRLSDDMRSVYGHRVVMVETFTDPSRHRGSCYAAANFRPLGETSGFGRRNGSWVYHGHPKRYWFYPLRKDAVRLLSASFDHPLLCSTAHEEARMIDLNQIVIDGDGGLRARLSTLVDHRKARGVRHDLVSLLLVCATAMLSGARNPTEIAEFGDALSEDLRARLGLRVAPSSGARVAPSLSTIQRTLRQTDKEAFDRVVCDTLAELVTNKRERDNNSLSADSTDDDTGDDTGDDSTGSATSTGASGGAAKRLYGVAVDGKTLRGAVQPDGRAIHLLAAMTHDDKVVIGQQEVDHKTNEIKLFAPLLADLDLKDALVTADALHTQDAHANFLVNEKHADFFLFVL